MVSAAALVAVVAPTPAQAAFLGKNDWIAFSALKTGASIQIWRTGGPSGSLVNLTGTSDAAPVMNNDNYSPAWSPERGAHMAFVSAAITPQGHGPGDIWWMVPFPSQSHGPLGLVNLTRSPDADDESPAWHFSGGALTWARAIVNQGQTGQFDIWRVGWTGKEPTNLTPGTPSDDIEPAWAPRSQVIAFASNRTDKAGQQAGSTYGIWLMNGNTGEVLRQLTADGRAPNWSPSGKLITFVRGGDVWTVHSNGTGFKRLTTTEAPHVNDKPVFSPDGEKILFETGRLGGVEPDDTMSLASINVDGTGRTGVLANQGFRGQSEPDRKPGCSVEPHKVHGQWVINGTPGPDLICYKKFPTTIYARGGNDSVYAGAGNNVIHAGRGDDIVLGGKGDDRLFGKAGADYLEADDGTDRIVGGPGNDQLLGGAGNDFLKDAGKGSGKDLLSGGSDNDVCVADSKRIDHVVNCETIRHQALI